MIRVNEIFKIGIGPSSSHTVGPMVAANRFLALLGDKLNQVTHLQIELYGSLAATGKGHATDTAVLLGLLGHTPRHIDTTRKDTYLAPIYEQNTLSLNGTHPIAFDVNRELIWHMHTSLNYHPNAMSLIATLNDNTTISETYYSIGGGFVVAHSQLPSSPNAHLSNNDNDGNDTLTAINIPYPFDSAERLLTLCQHHHLSISELMLANELSFEPQERIFAELDEIWQTMQTCVQQGCKTDGILPGGLNVKRRAKALYDSLSQEYGQAGKKDGGLEAMDWVDLYALAVNEENANGGKVVTAPTNGAAGIIPAVLHYYRDFITHFNTDGVHQFLLTAAAIGSLIKQNASISGAEVGCQGEVGSACAMAAAGLAAVLGATPAQCLNAAEIGLEHNLGLTCDPIAGLVQVPCIERNAMASVKAINAARLALRGNGTHLVSLDKAILTMKQTGADMLDKYKETARGGLAIYAHNPSEPNNKNNAITAVNLNLSVNFSQC